VIVEGLVHMNRTTAFANDFCRRIKEIGLKNYAWECGGKPLGRGHESIDILGTCEGRRSIFIEVELRKDAPLTNVVKVWRWVVNDGFKQEFVFVQAFSKYYKKGDTKRFNSEFVGEQMEKATGNPYLSLSFDYNPYRHGLQGAGRRRHHAFKLAEKIRRKLKSANVLN